MNTKQNKINCNAMETNLTVPWDISACESQFMNVVRCFDRTRNKFAWREDLERDQKMKKRAKR